LGSAGPAVLLGDGDPLAGPECPGEGVLELPAGAGAERSHSGKRPAMALAASAIARAIATIAVPTRTQNCVLSMPLREPVTVAGRAAARSRP
jgi:hypothetical protein